MLLQREKACLLIVDVQEKLTSHVSESDALVARCAWLMRLAGDLAVPLLVSEQYTRGLGPTVMPLRQWMPGVTDIDKTHFSCYRDASFIKHWCVIDKPQVVIAGIETHVCVLQTALDMHAAGIQVFVVVDAVSSRSRLDHDVGLRRMAQAGVQLVTSEMVFFEWVGKAGTPEFKRLSQTFLKQG